MNAIVIQASPNFDEIEFGADSSKMEIVCDKCHRVICWWPISTERTALFAAHGTKKSLEIPTNLKIEPVGE